MDSAPGSSSSSSLQNSRLVRTNRLFVGFDVEANSASNKEKELIRYRKLKSYFEAKLKALGIIKPLVNYIDEEQTIELGYTPKEVDALFGDFLNGYGELSYSNLYGITFSVTNVFTSPSLDFFQRFINKDYQMKN